MTRSTFRVNLEGITELDCFKEASKDELKILVAILAANGDDISPEELSEGLGISLARVKACITLFKEGGVLDECTDEPLAEVEYEFEPTKKDTKNKADTSLEVAKSIRENDLYELNREMELIFEKTLETREIERITSLYTKKGLSPEYILTLASYMATKGTPNVSQLKNKAIRLYDKGIEPLCF